MMDGQLRIGVMGCANIAGRSVIPAIVANPRFKLVAVASRTAEKAQSFAQQFGCKAITGYDQLLEEQLDAVYIPLPTGINEPWITAALKKGYHVLAEKSFGIDDASAFRMTALARTLELVAMEDYMFAYHSQHAYLMQLLANGTIGTIRALYAKFGFPPLPEGNFRYDPAIGGGALLDAGGYTVKAAQLILGHNLNVKAGALHYRHPGQADWAGSAMLVHTSGVPAHLTWGFDFFYQCGYEIWGTKGKISTNRSFTAGPGFKPSITLDLQGESQVITLEEDNHFVNILHAFADRIASGAFEAAASELEQQSSLLSAIRKQSERYEFPA